MTVSPPPPPAPRRPWRRLFTLPLAILAALVVLFEELVWDKVTNLVAWLARLRLVARLEAWIQTLGPYPTLALFAVPLIVLLPLKIAALYLIAQGRVALGIGVILVAKVVGTAISARLLVLAKPKLMTFAAFVWVYDKAIRFKAWAHAMLEGMAWFQAIRTAVREFKSWLRQGKERVRVRYRQWFPTGRPSLWQRLVAARRRQRTEDKPEGS